MDIFVEKRFWKILHFELLIMPVLTYIDYEENTHSG